jgi:hypothetical protein
MNESSSSERPRTRADCESGARPCPWVACTHHLLLEIGRRTTRARRGAAHRSPGLILNVPRAQGGRRHHLASSAAAELVRAWIDDALELLWAMPDSCALDAAERGASSPGDLQRLTGRSAAGERAVRRAAADVARKRVGTSAISTGPEGGCRNHWKGESDSTGRSTQGFRPPETSRKPTRPDGGGA